MIALVSFAAVVSGAAVFYYHERLALLLIGYAPLFLLVLVLNFWKQHKLARVVLCILPALLFLVLASMEPKGPPHSLRVCLIPTALIPVFVFSIHGWLRISAVVLFGITTVLLMDLVSGTWPDLLHISAEGMHSQYSVRSVSLVVIMLLLGITLYYTKQIRSVEQRLLTEKRKVEDTNAQVEKVLEQRTQELLENQDKLTLALEASDQHPWEFNRLDGIFYASPAWVAETGYSLKELRPKTAFLPAITLPEDVQRVREQLDRTERNEKTICVEHRIRLKNGAERWMSVHAHVMERDQTGTPFHWIGTYQDISEHKEAQLRLQESLRDQELVALISGYFNRFIPLEEQINLSLSVILKHFEAYRTFFYAYDEASGSFFFTTEATDPVFSKATSKGPNIPIPSLPEFNRYFEKRTHIKYDPMHDLSHTFPIDMDRLLHATRPNLLFVFPLIKGGTIYGIMGIEQPHAAWSSARTRCLESLAHVFTHSLYRQHALDERIGKQPT